ncbi:MAG: transcriptional repressor [Ignavibacteria bacterium CG22_combo_CG10-13_8_21_14_all_37_15]|nr:MAG: transcriptional repressor [Ignavibacteria bacterium CG22_combo_CG10-13_8_21_14_all_37_15]
MAIQNAADIFREFLKNGSNRITPERFEILDAALEFKGHFSADELFIEMKKKNSLISRATVYNTLELLAQCELLSICNFGDKMKRFESNFKKQLHDHLICVDCGRILEFASNGLDKIEQQVCRDLDFLPSSFSFNIFARCKKGKNCKYFHGN